MFKFLDDIGETRILTRAANSYERPDHKTRTTDVDRERAAHVAVAAFKEYGGSLRVEGLKEVGNRVVVAALGVAATAAALVAVQFTGER